MDSKKLESGLNDRLASIPGQSAQGITPENVPEKLEEGFCGIALSPFSFLPLLHETWNNIKAARIDVNFKIAILFLTAIKIQKFIAKQPTESIFPKAL